MALSFLTGNNPTPPGVLTLTRSDTCPPARARHFCPAAERQARAGLFCIQRAAFVRCLSRVFPYPATLSVDWSLRAKRSRALSTKNPRGSRTRPRGKDWRAGLGGSFKRAVDKTRPAPDLFPFKDLFFEHRPAWRTLSVPPSWACRLRCHEEAAWSATQRFWPSRLSGFMDPIVPTGQSGIPPYDDVARLAAGQPPDPVGRCVRLAGMAFGRVKLRARADRDRRNV